MFSTKIKNRREFIKACIRYSVVGFLLIGILKLVTKKPEENQTIQQCINSNICDKCKVLSKCNLPNALFQKRNDKIVEDQKVND